MLTKQEKYRLEGYEPSINRMRDELADPDCTAWTCPECRRSNYKGAVNAVTGEFIPFGLDCDECGFDSEPFVPAAGVAHHAKKGTER